MFNSNFFLVLIRFWSVFFYTRKKIPANHHSYYLYLYVETTCLASKISMNVRINESKQKKNLSHLNENKTDLIDY